MYWMTRRHPEWVVLNRGVNGERTDEILARYSTDVEDEAPDYVIVLAGVNDIFQSRPADGIRQNLRELYRRSTEAGIGVIGLSVLPYDSMSRAQFDAMLALNAWIEATSTEVGARFFDAHGLLSAAGRPGRLLSSEDGLHPDVAGYRLLGEALVPVVEDLDSRRRRGA